MSLSEWWHWWWRWWWCRRDLHSLDRPPLHLAVYERIITSGLRTTNGDEADFYYVPISRWGSLRVASGAHSVTCCSGRRSSKACALVHP